MFCYLVTFRGGRKLGVYCNGPAQAEEIARKFFGRNVLSVRYVKTVFQKGGRDD